MLSIGVPTYNRPKNLLRAIKSVQQQTFQNWELIISDDKSHGIENIDYLTELLKSDDRIRVFFQSENIGVKENYFFVLKKAKGEYFSWLSDDDYYHSEDYLQALMNKIIEGYDFVFPKLKKIIKTKNGYENMKDRNFPLSVNKRYTSHLQLILKGYLGYQVMYGIFKIQTIKESIQLFLIQKDPDEGAMTHFCLASHNWYMVENVSYIKDMTDAHLFRSPFSVSLKDKVNHLISVINTIYTLDKYNFIKRFLLIFLFLLRIIYIIFYLFVYKTRNYLSATTKSND